MARSFDKKSRYLRRVYPLPNQLSVFALQIQAAFGSLRKLRYAASTGFMIGVMPPLPPKKVPFNYSRYRQPLLKELFCYY
jgi:hypothetical protein